MLAPAPPPPPPKTPPPPQAACAAELMFGVRRDDALGQPLEAMRHLASISERHPAEGDAHAKIANLLVREGRFADADRSWQHAIAVEPTNPAWLIGRANNHLATDDDI